MAPPRDDDRLRTLARLGHGGMSEVWLAQLRGPAGFEKLVAVKRVRPDQSALGGEGAGALLREARLAALLNHPNIVHTFEVVAQDGEYRIVMELLEGQPFQRALRGGERPPLPDLVRVLSDLCAGLHAAHEATDLDGRPLGLVHRDVSPQNVFVTWDGTVKLLDFGIASFGQPDPTDQSFVKGKLGYMAPEQARAEAVDRRTDVFGVGALLFEVLAGQSLWTSVPTERRYPELVANRIPSVDERAPEAPEVLRAACRRALSPTPSDRQATADELRRALDGWLEEVGRPPPRRLGDLLARRFPAERERLRTLVAQARDDEAAEETELYAVPTPTPTAAPTPPGSPVLRMLAVGAVGFVAVASGLSAVALLAWWSTPDAPAAAVVEATCPAQRPEVELSGVLEGTSELTCTRDYRLEGLVEVTSGATLRIAAGTVVRGGTGSVLLVHPGGRLVVDGTAESPVDFRSAQATPTAGDWGGLVILGRAPVNLADPRFKGLRAEGHTFGGQDSADDSGSLRYTRIFHAGTVLAPNNETNGLTMAGVGRGTVIDHVLVASPADDCFEWFGGTVDAAHLVCLDPGDDGLDVQFGYVGTVSDAVVLDRAPPVADHDGIEVDNDASRPDAEPRSRPTFVRTTVCGVGGFGALVRRGGEAVVEDLVVGGARAVLDLRDHAGTAIRGVVTDAPVAPAGDDDGLDEAGAVRELVAGTGLCPTPPVHPTGGLRADDRWDDPWVTWSSAATEEHERAPARGL